MSNKKFQVFCRIIDYIDSLANTKGGEHFATLADIIRGTCTDMTLNSTRGRPGVTFLMPEKAYIDKIADLAYSSDISEAEMANSMLHSLILSNVYMSAAEMKADKYLANCCIPPQALEIKRAEGDRVFFGDNISAVPDSKFKSSKKKFAVWILTGEMPLKTRDAIRRPFTTDDKAGLKQARKVGKYEANANEYQAERLKIVLAIENVYFLHEAARRQMHRADCCDPYFHYAMGLLLHISKDHYDIFSRLMYKMSGDKTDIYFLIEPYKANDWAIPLEIIADWWAKNSDWCQIDIVAAKKVVDKWLADTKQDRIKRREQVQAAREEAYDNGAAIAKYIQDAYANNTDKLIEDEIRYIAAQMFTRFEQSSVCDKAQFEFISNYIADCLHEGKTRLTNPDGIRMSIKPIEKITEVRRFLNSSWFMYVPLCKSETPSGIAFRPKADRELTPFMCDLKEKSEHAMAYSNKYVSKDYVLNQLKDAKFREKIKKQIEELEA